MFYPKDHDFSLKVTGNNTKSIHGKGIEFNLQATDDDTKFNMLERKTNGEGHFSGAINFDIVRGIIYNYNDTFKPSKN